jgi:integrase
MSSRFQNPNFLDSLVDFDILTSRIWAAGRKAERVATVNVKGLVQRDNGFWYARSRINGKLHWRSLGTRDSNEALTLFEGAKAELKRTAFRPESKPQAKALAPRKRTERVDTIQGFSGRWLDEYVAQRRRGDGRKLAEQRLKDYILPVVGKLQLEEVGTPELRAIVARGAKTELSRQSIRHVLSDLRCLLIYAKECRLLSDVPSFRSVMPKIDEVLPTPLSRDDLKRILEAAEDPELIPIRARNQVPWKYKFTIQLGVLTGLRWGELQRLRWEDVLWAPFPHLLVKKSKSGKPRRVPLLPAAQDLLKGEQERRADWWKEELERRSTLTKRQQANLARTGELDVEFVVPFRSENPCGFVDRIEAKTGITWHFHQLRHSFACYWLEAGGTKGMLQEILGHSTIRLTERYGKLGDQAVANEASTIQSLF